MLYIKVLKLDVIIKIINIIITIDEDELLFVATGYDQNDLLTSVTICEKDQIKTIQ